MNFKVFYHKYKSVILYLFFGACTTFVNIASYWIFAHIFYLSTAISTWLAWFIGVTFAYITNRKWVFESSSNGSKAILKEAFYFFACRLTTGIIDIIFMILFVDVFSFNDILIKTLSNVLVIILNYVGSKFLVFKKN